MMIRDCLQAHVRADRVTQKAVDDYLKRLADAEAKGKQAGLDGIQAYMHAASTTAVDMVERAKSKRAEMVQTILTVDRVWEQAGQHNKGRFLGLINALGENLRGEAAGQSVATRAKAVYGVLQRFNADFIEQARSKFAGLTRDVETPRNVVRELYGDSTGDNLSSTSAKGWAESTDYAVKLLRAANVRIGKLEDWRLPQKFDPLAVRRLGKDNFVSQLETWWRNDKLRLRDWEADGQAYLAPGLPESEKRVRDILNRAYDNITTDGAAAIDPGAQKRSTLSDKYGRRRAFEWATADDWLEFNRTMGVGDDGIFDLMVAHLKHLSNDIASAQVLGPDPNATAKTLIAMFAREKPSKWRQRALENLYAQSSGRASTPVGEHFATFMQGVRNWLAASQLGGAILSAPTDVGFVRATAAWNGLSMTKIAANFAASLNPANKEDRLLAMRTGLINDVGMRGLGDVARDTMADAASRLPGRVAEFVMRAQGLAGWTQKWRDAFGMEFQGHFADMARFSYEALPGPEQRTLRTYGISEADWNILRSKAIERPNPDAAPFLDPARLAIEGSDAEREAALKFMGAIAAEQRYAVPEGNTISRAILLGQSQPGTLGGEFRRGVAQYKSFPIAVMLAHGGRALDNIANPDGSWFKGSYLAGMIITLTSLGALSINLKNIAQGKDAESMDFTKPGHAIRFWGRALMQGGGAGIFGDFLQNSVSSRSGRDIASTFAGPTAAFIGDTANLLLGNPGQYFRDEKTHIGREATRFANRYTPDLFYTRLAMDRIVWDSLQKMVDPEAHGTFQRMVERARKDQDVGFWWAPGKSEPSRAPRIPQLESQ